MHSGTGAGASARALAGTLAHARALAHSRVIYIASSNAIIARKAVKHREPRRARRCKHTHTQYIQFKRSLSARTCLHFTHTHTLAIHFKPSERALCEILSVRTYVCPYVCVQFIYICKYRFGGLHRRTRCDTRCTHASLN